ncbi:MAG TPA: ATP-dependent DNA ligase [Anaeromyxobacter sp.]
MQLVDFVHASLAVGRTPARLEKIALLAGAIRALSPPERRIGISWLAGDLAHGRIGIGWAALRAALGASPAASAPSLSIGEVDAAFGRVGAARGSGSAAERARILADLLARATEEERDFLVRLVGGELRQGALEGVLVEAVAKAASVPAADLRRAVMMGGSLPPVAEALLADGLAGLDRFRLRVLEPVQPMLAETSDGVEEALGDLGEAAFEWKLDGARVQVHRQGDDVRVFSRTLRDVTPAVPEIVEAVRALPARSLVLDGEAIALRPDGSPEPFQVTMRRFGRKPPPVQSSSERGRRGGDRLDVKALRRERPLAVLFFDALHARGDDLLALPARERHAALAETIPERLRVPRLVTADPAAASAFLAEALRRGHEGVMAKALDAPYEAGRRGGSWRKVKRVQTLDLVVLAAEWGHGRRVGFLSNLHLGARDPASGGFAMLGKTFKGMTDEMLAWQTERLQRLAIGESDGFVLHVRPELVVEVAFDGLQASPRYPSGLALRFARVKRYRTDKRPEEADTIDSVRRIFAAQTVGEPGEISREI